MNFVTNCNELLKFEGSY